MQHRVPSIKLHVYSNKSSLISATHWSFIVWDGRIVTYQVLYKRTKDSIYYHRVERYWVMVDLPGSDGNTTWYWCCDLRGTVSQWLGQQTHSKDSEASSCLCEAWAILFMPRCLGSLFKWSSGYSKWWVKLELITGEWLVFVLCYQWLDAYHVSEDCSS